MRETVTKGVESQNIKRPVSTLVSTFLSTRRYCAISLCTESHSKEALSLFSYFNFPLRTETKSIRQLGAFEMRTHVSTEENKWTTSPQK